MGGGQIPHVQTGHGKTCSETAPFMNLDTRAQVDESLRLHYSKFLLFDTEDLYQISQLKIPTQYLHGKKLDLPILQNTSYQMISMLTGFVSLYWISMRKAIFWTPFQKSLTL